MDTTKHDLNKRKTTLLICTYCGEMFEARNNRAKYCSRKCYYQTRRDEGRIKKYQYECIQCKQSFETANKITKFCSITCVSEFQRIEAIERAKEAIPRHIFPSRRARREYLRRKRIRDNFVEYVDINVLIQRDEGICQLCHEPVRIDVHYQHDLAPTHDHIIALSNGGEHSYANSQLAHRICNNVKNNHTDIEGEAYAKAKQKRKGTSSEIAN